MGSASLYFLILAFYFVFRIPKGSTNTKFIEEWGLHGRPIIFGNMVAILDTSRLNGGHIGYKMVAIK